MKFIKISSKSIHNISRNQNYKNLNQSDINFFLKIVGSNNIETENLSFYNTDFLKKYIGKSPLVIKPCSSEEISQILKYCSHNKIAITPQSGNTCLVGGSVPLFDEIIISMKRMNKILSYCESTQIIRVESGCILEDLNIYLDKYNKTMPLDLGAKGSCLIGGNLSTHAGGIHVVKYGLLRHQCLSITCVLPCGTIIKDKDIFKHILIGSEGTLGIITECEIKATDLFKYKAFTLIGCKSFSQILNLYKKVCNRFQQNITAIEFYDQNALKLVRRIFPDTKMPFSDISKFEYFLNIEVSSNNIEQNLYDEMLEFLSKENLEDECILTNDSQQMKELWTIRHKISEASAKEGTCFKYDISLELTYFDQFIRKIGHMIGDKALTMGYGHIGDYNLHLNICKKGFNKDNEYFEIERILEPYIFDYLKEIKGSISAEHGIGQAKSIYLNRSQSESNIKLMKQIKISIDPNNIMNPYKIFH